MARVCEILALGGVEASTCSKTVHTLAYAYVEALSLLDADGYFEIPEGLYT